MFYKLTALLFAVGIGELTPPRPHIFDDFTSYKMSNPIPLKIDVFALKSDIFNQVSKNLKKIVLKCP